VGARTTRWLLIRGRGDRPLDALVDAATIQAQGSSRRPSVEPGELCILYASVWQAVYGVAEVASEPEHDPARERWAWRFAIRPLVVVRDLHDAPAAEEAGIWPQSLWRHSHIRLTEEQFAAARRLIELSA
jgi:EVE domain